MGSQVAQPLAVPLSLELPKWFEQSLGKKREDKGAGRCKQVSRHASAPSAPPVFLSTVSVLLGAGRRSLRSSRVCLSWLFKVQDKRHAVVLSLFLSFFPRVHVCEGQGCKTEDALCHTVSYFRERIRQNDRQMSHSVKSYWFTEKTEGQSE